LSDHWKAILIGIVEGFTEFLPISSTGHMILVMPLLGVKATSQPWQTLLWVSQFGAVLAVVVYFWGDLWRRLRAPLRARPGRHIVVQLGAALAPTVVLALLLERYMERLEESPLAVACALVVGALAILWIDRRFRRGDRHARLEDITLRQAFGIGVIQCISMWPGTSRAAATILGGMVLGLPPRVATEFSFYLAIPTMLMAGVHTLWKSRDDLSLASSAVVISGTATSFVVALVVVAGFLEYVKRYRFTPFVVYRLLLGGLVLGYYGLRGGAA
jgi:undecaprenyl-diphosphatase